MADAFSLNEIIPTASRGSLYAMWRLTRVLVSAGWTVTQSGDGSTFGASDKWGTYAGLGSGAWIVLTGPGSRQLCLWRSTTSTQLGKILWDKSGAFTFASAGAGTPGTIPASAQYVRGSSGAFSNWFGTADAAGAVPFLHVGAKAVADGSFFVAAPALNGTQGQVAHFLALYSLAPVTTGTDNDPYIWCVPPGDATSSGTNTTAGECPTQTAENAGGTAGFYWGWARNTNWKPFDPSFVEAFGGSAIGGVTDYDPYSTPYNVILEPIHIHKLVETAFRERKGYTKWARRVVGVNVSLGDTFVGSTWCALGTSACVFWDGSTQRAYV